MTMQRNWYLPALRATSVVSVLVPLLVFNSHAHLFRRWIVDDAGITFAYARNLAQGYGLVSQPGVPPVEGYSNFLWVICYTPFFLIGLFDPLGTPKLLSYLFVIGSFVVARRLFRRCGDETGAVTFVVLLLLAMNTSFVAWCVSGLENPLYVFLLLLLGWQMVEAVRSPRPGLWRSAALGVIASAVAMTRPEGILYFAAYPAVALAGTVYAERPRGKAVVVSLLAYFLALVVVFGGFLTFRLLYFHDLLPNTFHAKGLYFLKNARAPGMGQPALGERALSLLLGMGGGFALLVSGLALGASLYLVSARRFQKALVVLLSLLLLSFLAYLLLPQDWMEEFRYATAFFVFFYGYVVAVFAELLRGVNLQQEVRPVVAGVLAAVFLYGTHGEYQRRSQHFALQPTVPFRDVAEWLAERYNGYADALGIEHGSLLVPDLGGTLFYCKLRIYDLGMLCDRTIARTLGRDQPAFYHYIFEVARPTFIHTHGSWALYANLDADPRFRRDYTPITEQRDQYASGVGGGTIYSGDYVRKEAVQGKEKALEELQRGWDSYPGASERPQRLTRGRFRRGGSGAGQPRGRRQRRHLSREDQGP